MNVLGDNHVVDGLLAFLKDRRASVGLMPCSRCLLLGRPFGERAWEDG
jgi:hypothetical protein